MRLDRITLGVALLALLAESTPVAAITADEDGLVRIPLIPHAVQRRRLHEEHGYAPQELVPERPHQYNGRRQLQQGADPTPVSELFQGYGTHYADLWCGTPPQRQTVIVDTGSGVTAFPCSDCKECGVPKYHSDGLFAEDLSTTFQPLDCNSCLRGRCSGTECRISMSYQEGSSWTAFEALDNCYVGGMHSSVTVDNKGTDYLDPFHAPAFTFGLKFGCQTHLTGLFITQLADGIMGMDNAKAAYWKQMFDAGVIKKEAFSLCFSRHDEVSRLGTESGSMTLGGTDPRLHSSDMVFADTNMGNGFYGVKLRNIYLREGGGGDSAVASTSKTITSLGIPDSEMNRGQFIVDSGTTDTYFARSFSPYFKTLFKEMAGFDYGHSKVKLTKEELDSMPTILFQLVGNENLNKQVQARKGGQQVTGLANLVDPQHPNDILIAMPPSHYMEFDADEGVYIARFYLEEGSGGVLGANAMMGHDVYFDVMNGEIGWAESSCDYTQLMKEHFPDFISREAHDNAGSSNQDDDDDDVKDSQSQSSTDDDEEVIELPESEFCSSTGCQASLVAVVVSTVVFVAMRLLRKTDVEYELTATNGLELQSAKPDTSGDIGYRDDHPGSFKDDDELSPHELS
mmetsp:Transcript_4712/g.9019  ORF Transcript_4712/g.9019 Transcript_4712/m.9019 type:complete len:626 (-) Transcript_4712:120-1997(-)